MSDKRLLRDQLVDELERAGRGLGVTRERLQALPGLTSLGYLTVPGSREPGAPAAAGAMVALLSCIEQLRDRDVMVGSQRLQRPAVEVCEVELGLGEWAGKGSLEDRRREAAARYDVTGRWYFDRRQDALGHLADELLVHQEDPVALSALLRSPLSLRTAMRESRFGLQRIWQEITVHLNEVGAIDRFSSRIMFRALQSGVSTTSVWHEYYKDDSPDVIHVLATELVGATLVREKSINGAHVAEIAFDHPLATGEICQVVLPLRVTSPLRASPRVSARDVRSADGLRPSVIVRFHRNMKPLQAWWFSQTGLGDEYECPPKQGLPISSQGEVRWEFEPLLDGGNFGIAWTWPTT